MLIRTLEPKLRAALVQFPVVALVGPRQVGKTTLAKSWANSAPGALYLDLEKPSDLAKLQDPELFLRPRQNQLVILIT